MNQVIELIKQNVLWVMIALIVVGFMAIAVQSGSKSEERDPEFVNVGYETAMYKGDKDAPVHIVVYTDFLCPYCVSFANDIMPQIEKDYIDTDKAQIEVRPVAMIGLDSGLAAEASFCAAKQDQFWPLHDALYDYVGQEVVGSGVNTREESVLSVPTLTGLLKNDKDFDSKNFDDCVTSGVFADIADAATSDAMANGVAGTPHVMINGNHIQNPTYEIMSSVIKAQL